MSDMPNATQIEQATARQKLAEVKSLVEALRSGALREHEIRLAQFLETQLAEIEQAPTISSEQMEYLLAREAALKNFEESSGFQEGGRKAIEYFGLFLIVLAIIVLTMIFTSSPLGLGMVAAINASLAVSLGIAAAGPVLPFLLLAAGGLLLSLELGLLATAAGLFDGKVLRFKGKPELIQQNASRLAIGLGLLLGIPTAIVALPAMPWYFAGLVGLAAGLGFLVVMAAVLSLPWPKAGAVGSGFFRRFFGTLPGLGAAGAQLELIMNKERELPLSSSHLGQSLPHSLSVIRDPISALSFTPEKPMTNEQISASFAALSGYIGSHFKVALDQQDPAITNLLAFCKEMQESSAVPAPPTFISLNSVLQACSEFKGEGMQEVIEKLGQYKAVYLLQAMNNPDTLLALIDACPSKSAKTKGGAESKQDYTQLLSHISSENLQLLKDSFSHHLQFTEIAIGGRAETNANRSIASPEAESPWEQVKMNKGGIGNKLLAFEEALSMATAPAQSLSSR